MLEASGMISYYINLQYLRTLLCGEAICEFCIFFIQIVSTTVTHLNQIILILGTYFTPANELSK